MGSYSLLHGIFPTQGSNSAPALQADSLLSEPPGGNGKVRISGMGVGLEQRRNALSEECQGTPPQVIVARVENRPRLLPGLQVS